MKCIIRNVFFLFVALSPLISMSQSWNTKTICKADFARTTGGTIQISPSTNDVSVSALSLKSLSKVEGGKAQITGNIILFEPLLGFEGIANLVYTACDANNNCGIGTVSILVVNPTKTFYNDTVYQGVMRNSFFDFYLPDADLLLNTTVLAGSLTKISDFHYRYTPAATGLTKEVIQFAKGNKKKTFKVNILSGEIKNLQLTDDIVYLNKNTSRLLDVKTNDANGFAITGFSQPTIGSLILNADKTFTFTTTLDFEGITTFDYTACNQGNCETAKVYLYVSDFLPREDLSPTFRTPAGKSLILPYEIPITNYEFKIIAEPSFGTLDFYKGNSTINSSCDQISVLNPLVYTPLPGYVGNDQFIVNFCLTNGTKQCAPLKIKVESYNDGNCITSKNLVWPGDANNDGLVNLKDINQISRFIGSSGTSRSNSSNNWVNQIAVDWNRALDINAKYADANGDGLVSESDIELVHENYNRSHKLLPQGIYQLLPSGLQISPIAAVIAPGEDAIIQFGFGSESNLLRDIESISFDLEFNNQVVRAEDLEVEILDNSWFGYNTPIINGRIDGQNKISVNFVSSLGKTKNGQGNTVKVKAKGGPIVTHVEGFKIPKELPLEFTIKNIQLGQSNGNVLGFADTKTKVMIDFSKQAKTLDVKPFPNPSTQYFTLRTNQDNELIERISVIDIAGKIVINKNLIPLKAYKQEVSHLQQGIYFVQVKTNKGLYTEKLEVIR